MDEVVLKHSRNYREILAGLRGEVPSEEFVPPEEFGREIWGIGFRLPIMNAAGVFKNGECYEMVARQGAGAYLGGTGTYNPRGGNELRGVYLPFVSYPKSNSSSNFMGLPNEGDGINSERVSRLERVEGMPIGWSLAGSPDFDGGKRLFYLVESMKLYDGVGVDFIEINESCPNIDGGDGYGDLASRLKYVEENFLEHRARRLPVVVKFSNDVEVCQIPCLLDLLFEFGFDGVNFGNTSADYGRMRGLIDVGEMDVFDYYVRNFGGGVSGKPLKELSLELAAGSVEYLRAGSPSQEFHILRTGGIESWKDIQESERNGISLNQWHTGYLNNFSKYGHSVYKNLIHQNNRKVYNT